MTEANQKILYEHFLKLVDNPQVNLAIGEIRAPGTVDKNFIVKQAKEQIEQILKVYPNFKQKEEVKVNKGNK